MVMGGRGYRQVLFTSDRIGGDMIERSQPKIGKSNARHLAQQGFTLVEMAIVLVIIGLIIGGILKGQEIVDNARVKSQVSQIDGIKAAIATFVDEYNSFPGDDANASTQIGTLTAANGNGDGFVSNAVNTPVVDNAASGATELNWVWYHLQEAGLISGVPLGNPVAASNTFSNQGKLSSSFLYFADFSWAGPTAASNKMIRIQGNNSTTVAPTPAVRVADANQIDSKYDDGAPATGNILAATYSSTTNCCNNASCQVAGSAYGLPAGGSAASPYCGLLWFTE